MGKKRHSHNHNHKQKPKRKISKVASSSGSGSPINTKNPIYYWDGVDFPQELQEEYKKALEQLKAGQYQALHLEKLHVHNGDGRDYWSIRTNQKGRLILTTEFIEGKRVLVFVRALPNHEYAKWERSLSSASKSSPIQDQQEVQSSSAEEVQFKDILQAVDTTQVTGLKSYLGKYILLSQPQNDIVEIDGPCIVNGVAGSGKTSSALFLASRWMEENPHGEVICIASSAAVVKGMKDEYESAQTAKRKEEKDKEEEKGKEEERVEKTVQFKTYAEWLCTDGGHKELKSRETILNEFEKWWEDYSQSFKERYRNQEKTRNRSQNKGHYSSSSSSLNFFTHADAPEVRFMEMDAMQLYQEFRKISNKDDYVKKGMGSFIAQGEEQQALRAVIYAAYEDCPDSIKEESEDFAVLQEQSKDEQAITLVLVDEAQDLSKKQIENLIQWSAARGLRIVFFRDSLQTVRDASSNYLLIKDGFVKIMKDSSLRQQEIKEINLPVSYRSFPAAKPWVDGWLDIRKKLTEKMDKTEVIQLEVKVNEHSAPGSVHWITEIDAQKQALFNAGCKNPSFAVVAPKEYLDEAKRKFNTQLVLTPEEIKGRQFKVVLVYRPFSPDIFKDASRILEQDRTKHSIRKQNNNNDLITSCNEVFVSLTRADSQMIIYQPEEHGINTLVNNLTKDKVVDVKADFSLILEKSDASEEKWLQEAKMQLRSGYREKAEEIIACHVKKEELKKEFIEFRMGYVEANKEPSCIVSQQEELKREKSKGKKEAKKDSGKVVNYANGPERNLDSIEQSEREVADSIYAEVKEKGEIFLPQLIALAERGNIYAQYKLYCFYDEEPSFKERYRVEAAHLCLSAANGGHPQAQYLIAKDLFFRAAELRALSNKADYEKIIFDYEKEAFDRCLVAVQSNDPRAQHLLCMLYGEGRGVELNMTESFFWCAKSAKQGFSSALYDLARLYYHGDGTEKDLEQAEFLCREAIGQGHQKAIFLLLSIEAEKSRKEALSPIENPIFSTTSNTGQHNPSSLSDNVFTPGSGPSSGSSSSISNVSHFKKKFEYSDDPYLALRQAAAHGNIEKFMMLIHSGQITDINRQGAGSGKTALHQAVSAGKIEIVKLLLQLNANTTILDRDGKSALQLAKEKNDPGLCQLLDPSKMGFIMNSIIRIVAH